MVHTDKKGRHECGTDTNEPLKVQKQKTDACSLYFNMTLIVCYDISNQGSGEDLEPEWMQELMQKNELARGTEQMGETWYKYLASSRQKTMDEGSGGDEFRRHS